MLKFSLLITLLFASAVAFCQVKTIDTELKSANKNCQGTVDTNGSSLRIDKDESKEGYSVDKIESENSVNQKEVNASEEIERLENFIIAVDTKIEHVKQDELENEKALRTGWYEKMETEKEKANKKIEKLKTDLED